MYLVNFFAPAVAVMSSMKYPKKLALATGVFFFPFVLFLYLGYEHVDKESHSIRKLQIGLSYQQKVKDFFGYIPLERGMTAAVQHGDVSYKPKVEVNFRQIESLITAVDRMPIPNSAVGAEWKKIKSEWRGIRKDIWKRSTSDNYRQHTVLIGHIIVLMQRIGDSSYTINDSDLSIYQLVQILSGYLPELVEDTGQWRAIGTRVILRHAMTFEEKNEATLLYGKIRSNLDAIVNYGSIACERDPAMKRTIMPAIAAIQNNTESLSDLFTSKILNAERWPIRSERYFSDATQTIDTYLNAYDRISAALQSHLDERLANLHRQSILAILIAATVLIFLIYFTVGFYLAFMGVLKELTAAALLISKGGVASVAIKTDDEMADVSRAFNNMAKKVGQSFAFLNSYKKAVDASNILSITDSEGNITYVNDQFCLTTGYTREELIGENHRILKDPETPEEIYRTMWDTISNKKIWSGTLKNIKKDGTSFYADSTITPILDDLGNIVEFVATRHEITPLINQQKQLVHQLYVDSLTQLPNRTKLLADLPLMQEPVLILINIDHFGEINDFYGADTGDEILIGMRDRIASALRLESWTLYRIYADEFALLCEKSCFAGQSYEATVMLLHSSIESQSFMINETAVVVQTTIGAVIDTASVTQDAAAHLLTDADMALRHAKRHEKDFVILHDMNTIRQEIARNVEYIGKIKEAVIDNRIIPFYQGIVDNAADSSESADHSFEIPKKYECLMRLIDSDGKIIAPFFFLDVAKKAKLYPQLTRMMIEKAFLFFEENTYTFSINLSVEDILDPKTAQFILDKLEHSGVAEQVIFEILESEGIENFEEVREFIEKVKQRGGRIAIDDFGSGYSNFAYLLNLQVDFIKIDASLIKNIDKDTNSRIIVETIVAFAQRLGIKTVAEFVHSKEISDIVKEIGVDFSQGFYFHEPAQEL